MENFCFVLIEEKDMFLVLVVWIYLHFIGVDLYIVRNNIYLVLCYSFTDCSYCIIM